MKGNRTKVIQNRNARERGAVFLAAGIVLPVLIMFLLGAFDIFRLMANRYVAIHEMASLLQDYKRHPAAVNLEQLKENAGFGLIDFNNDNSCIVVTAHETVDEAYEAAKNHSCETESITQITTSKPYFAVTTNYKHESLFAPMIYGAGYAGRTISMNEVLYVNLIECLENQIMVADGNGGKKCSENIEDVMSSIEQLRNGLSKLGDDLDKLEEKVDKEDERINKRIDDFKSDLTDLNNDLQNFKRTTAQQVARMQQQINSISTQVQSLQNSINQLWQHINVLHREDRWLNQGHDEQEQRLASVLHDLSELYGAHKYQEQRFADVYNNIRRLDGAHNYQEQRFADVYNHINGLYGAHNYQEQRFADVYNHINGLYGGHHWQEQRFADVYNHINHLWWWIGHLQNQINYINNRGWRHCYWLHWHHWPRSGGWWGYSQCHNGFYIANMVWEAFNTGNKDSHTSPEVHAILCCRP